MTSMSTTTTDPSLATSQDVIHGDAGVFFAVFGVVLPILAIHGFCGNIIAVIVYQLPKLKAPNTPYVVALLMADCFFLACVLAMYTPSSWVIHVHGIPSAYDSKLWHLQRIFTHVYPCTLISETMVVWFTLTYIVEQYNLMCNPLRSITWDNQHMGLKILFTVFSVSVIVHMLHFFKFTIETMRYGLQGKVWKQICLSDLFSQSSYQDADKYLYFLLFAVLPWVLCLMILGWILLVVWRNKRAHRRLDTPQIAFDPAQMRIFKRGRSLRSVVAIITTYLVLHAVSGAMYIATIDTMYGETDTRECHIGVTDFKFVLEPQAVELTYVISQVLYSSCKFWILFVCCSSFREVFYMWIKFQGRLMKKCASSVLLFRCHQPDGYRQDKSYMDRNHREHNQHDDGDDVYSIASGSIEENPYYRPSISDADTTMDSWTMELSDYNNKKPGTSYTRITYI